MSETLRQRLGEPVGSDDIPESQFGAPLSHDGALYPVVPFFVDRLDRIPVDGWAEILKSTSLQWVIIPWEKDVAED